jgi:hypothetical protein
MNEFKLSPEMQDALNKAAQGIEISPEEQEQLNQAVQTMLKAVRGVWEALIAMIDKVIAGLRRIGIELGRFFLKMQLLEWRVPNKIADYFAEHLYWYWAVRLGFGWFHRKFQLIE